MIRIQSGLETPETKPELFKILEEKKSTVGSSVYGSSHTYSLPGKGRDGVEVSIDADDVEDQESLQQKYNEQVDVRTSFASVFPKPSDALSSFREMRRTMSQTLWMTMSESVSAR